MIVIDSRTGSKDLLPFFTPYAVSAELGTLEFADVMFCGNSRDGDALIGIERKRLGDMVSCMRDKRFSGHQLPGLLENYEFVWLVVEGAIESGSNGELMKLNGHGWTPFYQGTRGVMYSELSSYLASMELRAWSKSGEPLRVKRTNGPKETVAWMVSLYQNFQKGWNQHKAHRDIYAPAEVQRRGFIKREVSLSHRMWLQVPGLDQIAEWCAKKWPMPEDFALVTVEELAKVVVEVHGKGGMKRQRLGRVRAEKIMPLLRRRVR